MSEDFTVLRDLQSHLRTAQVPFEQLSTLAQQGDDLLVERFLTENIRIQGSGPEVLQSQLYISCFWGMKEIVHQLLSRGVDINFQNKGTLWTPLHAAAFQEHGPVVMVLLENRAAPEKPDSEGRTPKDFASASDKIWPHFGALGLERTPRWELVEKSVIKKESDWIESDTMFIQLKNNVADQVVLGMIHYVIHFSLINWFAPTILTGIYVYT